MIIAKQLKDSNVCEYLLYMWQIEDTLRAYGCDAERLAHEYLPRFGYEEETLKQEAQWFADLSNMMREENVVERGHLQMNKGTLILLSDKHQELLADPKKTEYSAAYYKALPYIVELRAKGDKDVSELETCLDALYGVMLLRLQKREISSGTQMAIDAISRLLAMLNKEYTTRS